MLYIEGLGYIDETKATYKSPTKSYSTSEFDQILNEEITGKSNDQLSLDEIFIEASNKYDVPVNLIKAIAKTESNFNTDIVSSAGAVGVMQLMPSTASYLGVTDSLDPYDNIMGGTKLIKQLLDKYNQNTDLALAAYNAGSGNVDKYGGIPPFDETINYVKKVNSLLDSNTAINTNSSTLYSNNITDTLSSSDTIDKTSTPETVDKTSTAIEINTNININYSHAISNEEFEYNNYNKYLNDIFINKSNINLIN